MVLRIRFPGTSTIWTWIASRNADVATVGDTTCTFSTSPAQPTGRAAVTANPSANPPVVADAADLATATTLALVWNGLTDRPTKDQNVLKDVNPAGAAAGEAMVAIDANADHWRRERVYNRLLHADDHVL